MKRMSAKSAEALATGLTIAALFVVGLLLLSNPQALAQAGEKGDEKGGNDTVATATLQVSKLMDFVPEGTPDFNFELKAGDVVVQSFPLTPNSGGGMTLDLEPGTYTLTELEGGPYTTSIRRSDQNSSTQADGKEIAITLVAGEFTGCSFTNTDTRFAQLTVEKRTNFSSNEPFSFTLAGQDFPSPFEFGLNRFQQRTFTVTAGPYTITEQLSDANQGLVTSFRCIDRATGAVVAVMDETTELTLDLVGGTAIECDVFNTDIGSTLQIVKQTQPNSNDPTDFPFTVTGPDLDTSFTLDTDQQDATHQSNHFLEDLAAGTYTITEAPVDGWSSTIQCNIEDRTVVFGESEPAVIELPRNSSAFCQAINASTSSSALVVAKSVRPNLSMPDATVFDFSLTGADYSNDFQLDADFRAGTAPQQISIPDLAPGTYTLTETPVDGYTTEIECSDQNDGITSLVSVQSNTTDITIPAGMTLRCQVINTRVDVARLNVSKQSTDTRIAEGGPVFPFTLTREGAPAEEELSFEIGLFSTEVFELLPGEYTLTEDVDGYATTIVCFEEIFQFDPNRTPLVSTEEPTATFTLGAGQSVNCTVTNNDTSFGSIEVSKTLAPRILTEGGRRSDNTEGFDFMISGGPADDPFSDTFTLFPGDFTDGRFFNTLLPGTYTIQELDNGDYKTSIECFSGVSNGVLRPVALAAAAVPAESGPVPFITVDDGTSVVVELMGGDQLFCQFTNTDTARAIISVEKDVRPGFNDPTDFEFVITGPESFTETFFLDDDNLSFQVEARRIFDNLQPGDYTIKEELQLGYVTSVACYENDGFGDFAVKQRIDRLGSPFGEPIATSQNGEISFTVEGGQTVFCDFVNRVADATLVIVKDDTGDTGIDVPVTVVERGAQIANGVVSDDGANPVTLQVPIVAGFGFTLTETVPIGYTANTDAATCIDDEGNNIIRDEADIIYFSNASPGSANAEPAGIQVQFLVFGFDVGPGDTITCTLVNDPMPGSITITKAGDATDNTAFDFSLAGSVSDSFMLDADEDAAVPSTKTFTGLTFGQFTVSESAPGYTTEVACSDPDGGSTTGAASATIDLDPGEAVSCTFTNTLITTGTIVVVNDTAPDGPQDFSYVTTSPTANTASALPPGIVSFAAGFTLDDDADATAPGTVTFTDLDQGMHTITANAVAGFTTTIMCTDPDGGTTIEGLTAMIDLDATETVSCTFTHTADSQDSGGAAGRVLPRPEDDAAADALLAAIAAPPTAAVATAVPASTPLAVTGSESVPLASVALATIGIGISVLAADRTRRRRDF